MEEKVYFSLTRITHMSEKSKNKGYAFTTLLKYKQKYEDAEFEFTMNAFGNNGIPRSSVKKILGVVKLSDHGELVEKNDCYILNDVAIVYEDEENQIHIAIPIFPWKNKAKILENIEKIVITNKIEMLKKIIQEAVTKKKDSYICSYITSNFYSDLHYSKIIYYTNEVKVNGHIFPEKGFFYVNGNIYTGDKDVLNFAAKYIVELNGIKVNNLKELIQMFMKVKDKFYITNDMLANFKGNDVVSIGGTGAVPFYIDGMVIYTNDFKAEIDCGLILEKGVIVFSYEWVAASPDVWSALSTH